MAVNDVYSIKMRSGFAGSNGLQMFTYKVLSETTGATAPLVAAEFRADVVPAILDILQEDQPVYNVRTVNLFDDVDWEDYNYGTTPLGTRAGQALPSINVAGFESAKPSSSQDPARKRFGALSESDVQGNGLQDVSGYFAALNALAAQLGANLTDTAGNIYQPVVVKRIKYTTPGGKEAYRLPEGQFESVTFGAINWSWDNVVTSQVTRKPGRGI